MLAKINKQIAHLAKRRETLAALLEKGGYAPAAREEAAKGLGFKLRAKRLKDLKVACIMDPFTRDCFAPECDMLELTPDNWEREICEFGPELVFVESAWDGKDKLWYKEVSDCKARYFAMASYCREHNIPVVYWGKEDPGWTEVFLAAASLADVVFTTEVDCVRRYKSALGHDRVYHLHFAAQPRVHNPIEKYQRKDKFCFAGAYYHRYEQRSRVFDAFAKEFIAGKGLDIYDRNYPSPRPEHAFPKQYGPYILGRLETFEIDKAYKGYAYAVNMNSAQQTQTMFARRVFELLASNTVTVGNYSRGLKNYFGDLTICTEDAATLHKGLTVWCGDETTYRKYRLAGLRKALSEHLYEDRLACIVEKVFGEDLGWKAPLVTVAAVVASQAEADHILACFERQNYENKQMVLVSDATLDAPGAEVVPTAEAKGKAPADIAGNSFLAVFSPKDYYGENYLLDLALLTRVDAFDAVGKAAHYSAAGEGAEIRNGHAAYRPAQALLPHRAMMLAERLADTTIDALLAGAEIALPNMLAADEFNYCAGTLSEVGEVGDLFIPDTGIPLAAIERAAINIRPTVDDFLGENLTADDLVKRARLLSTGIVTLAMDQGQALLTSRLPEGKHEYFFLSDFISIDGMLSDGELPVTFEGAGDLDLVCVCSFLDAKRNKLAALYPKLNRAEKLAPPRGAAYMQLGFRPKGPGACRLRGIRLSGASSGGSGGFLSRSNVLVLLNRYPELPDGIYQNMFVHKRVMAYKEEGRLCDVMCMSLYAQDRYREYDGVNIVEGHAQALAAVLENGRIDTVCVHFLDAQMWGVLKQYLSQIRLIIWSHGADIQLWWRRKFNCVTDEEVRVATEASDQRMAMWKEVFAAQKKDDIHIVFVSKYAASETMEDYGITLDDAVYSVIHNGIDFNQFTYVPKAPEQRKKVLTIKSFSTKTYANDITANAILELSTHEAFKDMEFHIYGDGELFAEVNRPLKKFKNVYLNRGFIRPDQIADTHKGCGIFIATTRTDTQGVSRDEAMASGLVPVTNAVAAVPEFVDGDSGILVPGEDYKAIAEGILRLYKDPELFERLSKGAAQRVRRQSGKEQTIDREIALIFEERR